MSYRSPESTSANEVLPYLGRLAPAELTWREGTPIATPFADGYYQHDAVAESRYIYIEGNQLPERFATDTSFCIVETGFGMGLNFALTVQAWRKSSSDQAQLQYVSIEKFPASREELRRSSQYWQDTSDESTQELRTILDEVLEQWPAIPGGQEAGPEQPVFGWHIIRLAPNIQLVLIFDDIETAMTELAAPGTRPVQAWFLDGFAPSRNPDMWGTYVFDAMRRLSHSGCTATSFSCARIVKDGLHSANFKALRRPGYGTKRDSLVASHIKQTQTHDLQLGNSRGNALVVGAGIAGTSTALRLQEAGYQVRLVDRAECASGTSANPGALCAPPVQAEPSAMALWALQAYAAIQRNATALGLSQSLGWITMPAERASRLRRAVNWMFGLEAGAPATSPTPGAWVPMAYGSLQKVCATLLERFISKGGLWDPQTTIDREAWQQWQHANKYQVLVDCTGTGIDNETSAPPIRAVRGQITRFEVPSLNAPLPPMSGPAYLAPGAEDATFWTGATFTHTAPENYTTVSSEDDEANRTKLGEWVPELAQAVVVDHWANARTLTPDHLPYIGPCVPPDMPKDLPKDLRRAQYRSMALQASHGHKSYTFTGTGTRGIANGQLGAEVLVAMITGSLLPVPASVAVATLSTRFPPPDKQGSQASQTPAKNSS